MSPPPPSDTIVRSVVTAVLMFVFFAAPSLADAAPYQVESDGPRIGTRISNFFKDLAYGRDPNERYRRATPPPRPQGPPPSPYAQPRSNSYGARSGGTRYSLDAPPPAAGRPKDIARQPLPMKPQPEEAPPNVDLPYPSGDAPDVNAGNEPQAGIGGQSEDLPPVTIKAKNGSTLTKPAKAAEKTTPESAPKTAKTAGKTNQAGEPAAGPVEPKRPSFPVSQAASGSLGDVVGKSWQQSPPPGGASPTGTPTTDSAPAQTSGSNAESPTLIGSPTTAGRVKSPYPPYNELDVTGLPSGSLATDPTTGKVFRVP